MPDSPARDNSCALVLAAHGSQTEPRAALDIHRHVERLQQLDLFSEVRAAFWKELPSWRTSTLGLKSTHIIVVPMLMSAGYFAQRVLPRELAGSRTLSGAHITHTPPVGTHPKLQHAARQAITTKLLEFDPSQVTVVIAGHGTDRHAQSKQSILDVVALVQASHHNVRVCALFLDEAPRLDTFQEVVDTPCAIVLPYFIASGQHTLTDIPEALGVYDISPARLHEEALDAGGIEVHYLEPVGAQPGCVEVILSRAREGGWGGQKSEIFAPPIPPPSLGVVRVLAHPHSWELRHLEDLDSPADTLHTTSSPLELWWMLRQQRARVSARSLGYRTLPFALPMPSGWRFVTPDLGELHRALELILPGALDAASVDLAQPVWLEEVLSSSSGLSTQILTLDEEVRHTQIHARCEQGCMLSRTWKHKTQPNQQDNTHTHSPPMACLTPCPTLLSELLARVQSGEG